MRLIFLLIALAVVALLVTRQIGPGAATAVAEPQQNGPPAVPTRPQDLPAFEQDINQFMQDSAAQRQREIDEQTR